MFMLLKRLTCMEAIRMSLCGLCSPDQNERLGGVLSVDELIDAKVTSMQCTGM